MRTLTIGLKKIKYKRKKPNTEPLKIYMDWCNKDLTPPYKKPTK